MHMLYKRVGSMALHAHDAKLCTVRTGGIEGNAYETV